MSFLKDWNRFNGKVLPIGYLMRIAYPSKWFRIHHLPNSKRYPDNSEERAEALRRHRSVFKRIFDESDLVMFVSTYIQEVCDIFPERAWSYGVEFSYVGHFNAETDNDPSYRNIFATKVKLRDDQFDQIIVEVMNEEIGPVLFFNPVSGSSYAPYDGGGDLFLEDPQKLDELKSALSEWRSPWDHGR